MAADVHDLEDLIPYASTSTAAGERRTEVKREDSLTPSILAPLPTVKRAASPVGATGWSSLEGYTRPLAPLARLALGQ